MDRLCVHDRCDIKQLWYVFQQKRHSSCSHLCHTGIQEATWLSSHNSQSGTYKQSRKWTLFGNMFPTVLAQESATELSSEDEVTISEKLMQKIPTVLVTDNDIQEYLSTETGFDRLRVLYSKE